VGIVALAWLLSACTASPVTPSLTVPPGTARATASSAAASSTPSSSPTPTASPSGPPPGGVYATTVSGQISSALAGVPERVYVPDEISGDVVVIDPATFKIVRRFKTGLYPEHVTPDWDLSRLLVSNMNSSTLTVIDSRTSRPSGTIKVPIPYAVYFTLDGTKAVVVNDLISPLNVKRNGLYFYDRRTWKVLKFVQIPYPGADDLDMSADGRYLMVSCEYSGRIAKVDTRSMRIVGSVKVGSLPRDVRLAPDGKVFFVANEGLNLVQVVDPVGLKVVASIPTGAGTHGLEFSRDATRLYVNNRTAGTITVIDVATLRVITTWRIGGSPDEMVLSPDGTRLWISNRRNGGVSVVDTRSGKVLATIATGDAPHGLTYWPQPGTMSVGQNGNMR
jgi:YVTN family beta-propeller protein